MWAPQGFFFMEKTCGWCGSGLICCDAPKVLVARLKVSHTHTPRIRYSPKSSFCELLAHVQELVGSPSGACLCLFTSHVWMYFLLPRAVDLPNSTARLMNYLLHNTFMSSHPPALPLDPMVTIQLPSFVVWTHAHAHKHREVSLTRN